MGDTKLSGCICEHPAEEHLEELGCSVWRATFSGYCECWAGSEYMREDYEASKVKVPTLPAEDPSVIAAPVYEEHWEYSGFGKKRLVQTVTGPWIAESEDV